MNKSVLSMMKRHYEISEKIAKSHNKKVKELKKLLEDPNVLKFIVKEDIKISGDDLKEMTEDDIIEAVLSNFSTIDMSLESNDVFFCDGVVHPDMADDYKIYRNLEDNTDARAFYTSTGPYLSKIYDRSCANFEGRNIVVYGDDYRKVRNEFLLSMIKEGQEEAIKSIVKKYPKK